MALRDFMAMHPGVVLETWTTGDRAIVDLLRVPPWRRRQGLGSMTYSLWERTLASGMMVQVLPVDACATAFWCTLGFEGHDDGVMSKRIMRAAMAA